MASLARSASQSLRASARRAPRSLVKSAVRPTQAASYSLFARAAAAKVAQTSTAQVRQILKFKFSLIYL